MPIQARDVVDIITHKDVVDELGSEKALRNVLPQDPPDPTDPTKHIRTLGYRDVLIMLERRRPPITESMISRPDDLKNGVLYATLARLFRAAVTAEGDRHFVQWQHWQKEFTAEVQGLRLMVEGEDVSANTLSIPMERR